jgi:hypothetical protein
MLLSELLNILQKIKDEERNDVEVFMATNPNNPNVSDVCGVTTDVLSKKDHSGYGKCVILLEGEHVRYGWSDWWLYAE